MFKSQINLMNVKLRKFTKESYIFIVTALSPVKKEAMKGSLLELDKVQTT